VIAVASLLFLILLLLAVPVAFRFGRLGSLAYGGVEIALWCVIVQQALRLTPSASWLCRFRTRRVPFDKRRHCAPAPTFCTSAGRMDQRRPRHGVVVAEYIFSGLFGSTVADVSDNGATMIPPLKWAGYFIASGMANVRMGPRDRSDHGVRGLSVHGPSAITLVPLGCLVFKDSRLEKVSEYVSS
jgi:hypothetical protein